MVEVPAGPFVTGCGAGPYGIECDEDEYPLHEVDVPRFQIDRTEVTNAAFAAFLTAEGNRCDGGRCADDLSGELRVTRAEDGVWSADEGYAEHPVVEVSWYGARAYCAWRGKRLCSEAEWEKAARGTDGRHYPWGNGMPTCAVANRARCADGTLPVATDETCTSPYGACDLAGNVWEWVEDDWHPTYDGAPTKGSAWRTPGATSRVHRGGSWRFRYPDVDARASNREPLFPTATGDNGGFRCCRTLPRP